MTNDVIKKLDNEIYARKAVAETRNAFQDFCTVKATPIGNDQVELAFKINEAHSDKSREIILEFLNYTLDRSIQLYLEELE